MYATSLRRRLDNEFVIESPNHRQHNPIYTFESRHSSLEIIEQQNTLVHLLYSLVSLRARSKIVSVSFSNLSVMLLYNVYCSTVNFYRRLWNGFELSSTINILFDISSTSSTLALLSWVGYESIADAVLTVYCLSYHSHAAFACCSCGS